MNGTRDRFGRGRASDPKRARADSLCRNSAIGAYMHHIDFFQPGKHFLFFSWSPCWPTARMPSPKNLRF